MPALAALGRSRRHDAVVGICSLIVGDGCEGMRDLPRATNALVLGGPWGVAEWEGCVLLPFFWRGEYPSMSRLCAHCMLSFGKLHGTAPLPLALTLKSLLLTCSYKPCCF